VSLAGQLGIEPLVVATSVAGLRYLLAALALVWGLLALRREGLMVAVGLSFALVATGYWSLALARPRGLLVDPQVTTWAAQASVVLATGDAGEGILSGQPPAPGAFWLLPHLALQQEWVLLLPTLLPPLLLVGVAVAVLVFWEERRRAWLATALWLVFSTGDLDTLRGAGFLPGSWVRLGDGLGVLVLVTAALAVGRLLRRSRWAVPAVATVVAAGWALLGRGVSPLPLWERAMLLCLDQGPWLPLAVLGWRRRPDSSSIALALGGGALVLGSGTLLPVDVWGAHAFYRLGLLLAASGLAQELAVFCGARLGRFFGLPTVAPERLGAAALIVALVPGAFITSWDPAALDPVTGRSLEPISPHLLRAMEWVREQTPPGAVFVAGPDYAPAVAALGGRRLLRAPGWLQAPDEERRLRAERQALSGRPSGRLGRLYGIGYVLATPGEIRKYGIDHPAELARRGLRLRHVGPGGFYVFEIPRAADTVEGGPPAGGRPTPIG
jgi:hypothetical protein